MYIPTSLTYSAAIQMNERVLAMQREVVDRVDSTLLRCACIYLPRRHHGEARGWRQLVAVRQNHLGTVCEQPLFLLPECHI